MALKPTRITVYGGDSVAHFMNEVAERGKVVTYTASSTASGNLDDPNSTVIVPTGALGTPVGVLMNDVVSRDLTVTHMNAHKDEVPLGGKVTVLKIGTVSTNQLKTGDTPVAGNAAHFTTDGEFTTTTTSDKVGTFASAPDADGYVVVDVRL